MAIRKVALIFDDQIRPDTTGGYCRRALRGLVEVEHFLPADLSQVPRTGFDLYLNIDDGMDYRLPDDLRPRAWWAIDTHLDPEWCLERAAGFDFVFAAQRDGAEQLQQAGVARACWLPLACDPEVHRQHEIDKKWDVCFVGNVFPGERADLLELLRRHIPKHFIGQCFFEEMARTYSASRLVFNRSIRNDINMRVFEALACGSLLLTNDLKDNGQEDLFRDGEHLATYRNAEELLDKVRYYLSHEGEREKVAAAGRAEVLARDTYRHRMQLLLCEVERGLARTVAVSTPCAAPDHVVDRTAEGGTTPAPPNSPSGPKTTTGESLVPEADAGTPNVPVEWRSALAALVPQEARKILLIGSVTDPLAEVLRARPAAEVVTLEIGTEADREALDRTLAGDGPAPLPALAAGPFDAIVCGDFLEQLPRPARFLRRGHAWLRPSGQLVAGFGNVRHHHIVQGLLEGSWTAEAAAVLDRPPAHLFTRRGMEKLFFRTGYGLQEVRVVPGPGHAGWVAAGRPGDVRVGRLHIAGLAAEQAEEFYASRFLVAATPAPSPDYGLTSIVILTHNQLEYTRQCVDSIRRYTDEAYELIFVDNASTDGTGDYLRSLSGVKVITNPENRGFPAAANQGIQAAAGRQVLLLNNDTVVTTGWLQRLLRTLASDPRIGLVGPCSNRVSGEQQVEAGYEDLAGLDGFAWEWGKRHNRAVADTDRLVGFCLLVRREVFDRVGLLDERFGLGCFEDDDLCLRALRAGYRAVIARDAFVHHFGGRTFVGSGVDFAGLMQKNEQLFRAKWAEGEKADTPVLAHPPSASPAQNPAYSVRTAPAGGLLLAPCDIQLSVCMIVRDNARTIEAALTSIRPWVDEMIIVDTGSKDNTPEIVKRLGARLYYFPWCDSFSAARNESVRHARGKWVFWMDSDDTIDAENGRKLRELACREPEPSVLGYVMQVHCPGPGEDGQAEITVVDHVKLFRNLPHLRFEGRIHEQVLPAIYRAGGDVRMTDLFVVHTGYDHSPQGQEKKIERDLRLLHLELKEQPEHPFTLFNLGMTYADIGEYAQGADFLRRCLERSPPQASHVRKAYALLVHCYEQAGEREAAWAACQQGLQWYPKDAELNFRKANLLLARGRLAEAVQAYQSVLQTEDEPHFGSVVRGITGHLARQNLAVVYTDLGESDRAEEQWRLIVQEVPRYRPGWQGLGEILVRQGKLSQAQELADRLMADPYLRGEGRMLHGRVAAAQGDIPKARRALEGAARECPNDPAPLGVLSRLLFERREWGEAERALKEQVRRDPKDASAYHNLGQVCMAQGQHGAAADWFRQSLRCRPDHALTYLELGNALKEAGQPAEAVTAWEQGLRLEPGNARIQQALGQARQPRARRGAPPLPQPLGVLPGSEGTYTVQVRDRKLKVSFTTRGPVDQAILRLIWERDVYGVWGITEPPRTVVDIGAHIGAFALLAAEAWPAARVIACEADPDNCTLLRKNLQGRQKVEIVPAAIVADDVPEVDFNMVADKARYNSGGGSCVRDEPFSVKTRVPAMSVIGLWKAKGITTCEFLKLDCEGCEIPILKALAGANLLAGVRHIAGEWHAADDRPATIERVKGELRAILQATHQVVFSPDQGGREGYFTARVARR
jgi:FkbM family methyltransferase